MNSTRCPLEGAPEKDAPLNGLRNTNATNLIKALDKLGWEIMKYDERDNSYGEEIALMIQKTAIPRKASS